MSCPQYKYGRKSLTDPFKSTGTNCYFGCEFCYFLAFLYISMNYIHQRKFISLINTDSRFSWSRVLKGGIIWFALFTIGILLSLIIDPSGLKITFNPNTFGFLLILSLLVFPIQASFEELFFRGYLMQGFGLLSKNL